MTDNTLPSPYPPLKHPPFIDLSFAALGWLCRAAVAAGSDPFDEAILRTRFYLDRAAAHAHTPAEIAVLAGFSAGLDSVVHADADARELLSESVSQISAACADEIDRLLDSPGDNQPL